MSDWAQFTPPEILEKRLAAPVLLRCYCCREQYEKGHFACCAPPAGMASRVWLSKYCGTCLKCPKHCACVPEAKV